MRVAPEPVRSSSSDAALLEFLRVKGGAGVGELAAALGVTATAVRQRLERLTKAGLLARSGGEKPVGRGRPAHRYSLTDKGRQSGGDNFRDLALVLWREIRSVREPDVRRGLLTRIGSALAGAYRDRVTGPTPQARLERVADLLRERQVSCVVSGVEAGGGLPVLTTYACPYPHLAEEDRGICAAERQMLEELVGTDVKLSECRLDGAACCRFTALPQAAGEGSDGP